MILFINTRQGQTIFLAFINTEFSRVKNFEISLKSSASAILLKSIDDIMRKNHIRLSMFEAIAVIIGPGRFSSLRTGVTCANILAWTLNIPVLDIRQEEFERPNWVLVLKKKLSAQKVFRIVTPVYGKEPNITVMPRN